MAHTLETCPWTTEFPFRNIKANEFNGSQANDYHRKMITLRNMNGVVDADSKYYNFIKVLKSTTTVIHWLIKLHNKYFVISQAKIYQLGDACSIYEATRTGKYDINNPIAIYMHYIDIESAADRFSQEYMAMLINTNHPDIQFIHNKEIAYHE